MNNDVTKLMEKEIQMLRAQVLLLDDEKYELERQLEKERMGHIKELMKERNKNQKNNEVIEWREKEIETLRAELLLLDSEKLELKELLDKERNHFEEMYNEQRQNNYQELKCHMDMMNDVIKRKEADIDMMREEVRGDMLRLNNHKAELEERLHKETLSHIEELRKERYEHKKKLIELVKEIEKEMEQAHQMRSKQLDDKLKIQQMIFLETGEVLKAGIEDARDYFYMEELERIRNCEREISESVWKLKDITDDLEMVITGNNEAKIISRIAAQDIQSKIITMKMRLKKLQYLTESEVEEAAGEIRIDRLVLNKLSEMKNPIDSFLLEIEKVNDESNDIEVVGQQLEKHVNDIELVYKEIMELMKQMPDVYPDMGIFGPTKSELEAQTELEQEEVRRREREMMAELDRKEEQMKMEQAEKAERRRQEKEERERIHREQMEQKEKSDKAIMEEKQRQRQREDQQNMLDQQQVEKQTKEMNDMINRQRIANHQELTCQMDMNNDVIKRKEGDINKIRDEVRGDMLRLDNQKAELEEKLNKEKLGYIEDEKKERKENQEKLLEWEKKKLEAIEYGEQMRLKHSNNMKMLEKLVKAQIGAVIVAEQVDTREINYVQQIANIRNCALTFLTPVANLRSITTALQVNQTGNALMKAKAYSTNAATELQNCIISMTRELAELQGQTETNMEGVAVRIKIAGMLLDCLSDMMDPRVKFVNTIGAVTAESTDMSRVEQLLTQYVEDIDIIYKNIRELINKIPSAYRNYHVQGQIQKNMQMLLGRNGDHENDHRRIEEGGQQ